MASHGEGLRPSSVVPVLVPIDPLADQALRPGRVELLPGLLIGPPILAVLFGEPDPFGCTAGPCRLPLFEEADVHLVLVSRVPGLEVLYVLKRIGPEADRLLSGRDGFLDSRDYILSGRGCLLDSRNGMLNGQGNTFDGLGIRLDGLGARLDGRGTPAGSRSWLPGWLLHGRLRGRRRWRRRHDLVELSFETDSQPEIGPQDPALGDLRETPDRERKTGLENHLC